MLKHPKHPASCFAASAAAAAADFTGAVDASDNQSKLRRLSWLVHVSWNDFG